MLRTLLLSSALIALSAPDGEAARIRMTLDPAESSLAQEGVSEESLSGLLVLRIDPLPLVGSGASFDVIDLQLTTSGGSTLGLAPGVASPGLGVLGSEGSFLVPTLFVRITADTITDLPIPDVEGEVLFDLDGMSIRRLATEFAIETHAGIVSVRVVAVPEPHIAVLLVVGLAGLCAGRSRQESC
jgi:hypothetical protein